MKVFKKVRNFASFSTLLVTSISLCIFLLCTTYGLHSINAGETVGTPEPIENYINPLWSPDGKYLLLTDRNSNGVYVYNTEDSTLFQITDAPSSGYKYNWSCNSEKVGFKLLVKTDNGSYIQMPVIYDLEKKEMTSLHNAVNKAGIPSFSKDGSVAFSVDKELVILNKDGNIKNRIHLRNYANLTPLSPDGTKIVYNDENDQIRLINSDGSNRRKLTSDEHGYFNPVWSPDSSKIVISTLTGELKVIDISFDKIFDLDKGDHPSWSPDSQYILYSQLERVDGYKISSADIYLIKYDGSQKMPKTTTKDELEGYVNWSPDGEKIAFGSYRTGNLFFAPMHTATPTKESEAESLPQLGSVEKMQYRSLEKWEGTIHPGSDHRKLNSYKNKHLIYLASSTTSLNNVPYIHQVYDTPNTFNGHWACNASSALMAITYYGILSYWDTTVSSPYSHTSHYGRYVSDTYTYNGNTYNTGSSDASNNTAYGGYGYIVRNN